MYQYSLTTLHSYTSLIPGAALALAASVFYFHGSTNAEMSELLPAPVIDTRASLYDPAESRLILKGANFCPGATVILKKASSEMQHGPVEVVDSRNLIVSIVEPIDMEEGVEATALNLDGQASPAVNIALPLPDERLLTENDVKTIIARATAEAEARGLRA